MSAVRTLADSGPSQRESSSASLAYPTRFRTGYILFSIKRHADIRKEREIERSEKDAVKGLTSAVQAPNGDSEPDSAMDCKQVRVYSR